nr:trypsin-like peptidase domain-containing protein [Salinilacihabitans rarus]
MQENDTQNESDDAEAAGEDRYASVYDDAIDSVVLVSVGPTEGRGPGRGATGSGFVYDEEHVLTNAHVVGGAEEVSVQFVDEEWRAGTVVGTDPHGDLAVVRVADLPDDATPLPLVEGTPDVGEEVVALGSPLGLDASISAGIVSGLDRSLPSPAGFSIPATIQTDAPVNPGNSGGPLVNLDGEVVGIVFAGAGQNIGFAIPAALVRRVVPALIEDGEYAHPYLGVGVVPITPPVAEANDLDRTRGVLVSEVAPGSPADGTIEPAGEVEVVDGEPVPVGGDVIVDVEGESIPNQDRLASYLALETAPGEAVEIGVRRDGERETLEVTLGERPDGGEPR